MLTYSPYGVMFLVCLSSDFESYNSIVIDYRKLNEKNISDFNPIPNIEMIVGKLTKKTIFQFSI